MTAFQVKHIHLPGQACVDYCLIVSKHTGFDCFPDCVAAIYMKPEIFRILERIELQTTSEAGDGCAWPDAPVSGLAGAVAVVRCFGKYFETLQRRPFQFAHHGKVLSEQFSGADGSVHKVEIKPEVSESESVAEDYVIDEFSR